VAHRKIDPRAVVDLNSADFNDSQQLLIEVDCAYLNRIERFEGIRHRILVGDISAARLIDELVDARTHYLEFRLDGGF
jgi:hypothetical protein